MKTNFFQHIAALQTPGTFKMAITLDEQGNITVSELFTMTCGDKAASRIVPLSLSGKPEELDEVFFEQITAPAQKTAGVLSNMEGHLKSIEAAKLASKMEQDKKQKENKSTTPSTSKKDADHELPDPKAEKKKAYDEAMKAISELNANCKYDEALALLPSAEEHPDKAGELEKLRADLNRKSEQFKQIQLF